MFTYVFMGLIVAAASFFINRKDVRRVFSVPGMIILFGIITLFWPVATVVLAIRYYIGKKANQAFGDF